MTQSIPDIWSFVCEFYQHPQVESSCLQLQDDFGVDVIFLLLMLWGIKYRQTPNGEGVGRIKVKSSSAQMHIISPLRELRRDMKTEGKPFQGYRQQVKDIELSAERWLLESFSNLLGQNLSIDATTSAEKRLKDYFPELEKEVGALTLMEQLEKASLDFD